MPSRAWTYRAAAAAAILVVGVFVGRTFFPAPAPLSDHRAAEGSRVASPGAVDEHGRRQEPAEEIAVNDRPAGPGADTDEPAASTTEGSSAAPAREAPLPSAGGSGRDDPARPAHGNAQVASADDRAMRYIEKSQMLLIALVNGDPEPDAYGADLGEQRRRSRELVREAAVVKDALDDPRQRRLRELVSELEKILMQIANLESDEDLEAVEFIRSRVNDHDVLFKINLEQMRHGEDGSASDEAQGENLKRSL
jgi:hypothetical protein